MRKQLLRLLCRVACLGSVWLAATAVRADLISLPDQAVSSFASESIADSVAGVSLVEIGQSPSWLKRTGELVENAPSELLMKEFHPAPEPSGLVLALVAMWGATRLLRSRK